MASRLMRTEATMNKYKAYFISFGNMAPNVLRDIEVEDLLTLMGRFFQIRDDYQNLRSSDVSVF
jgi:hypothetical protein